MIKGYFGVPGCGKSTTLVKEYRKNKKKYENIYSVNIKIDGVKEITKEDVRKYRFKNALILWDEITLDYDNRNFDKTVKDIFTYNGGNLFIGIDANKLSEFTIEALNQYLNENPIVIELTLR